MEEKFSQIKLNVGSVEEASVESEKQEKSDKKTVPTKFDEPDTIPFDIIENRQESKVKPNTVLVQPDVEVFDKVANKNQVSNVESYTTDWHNTEEDSDEKLNVTDAFASTTKQDRKFMETFGINGTGSFKSVGEKETSFEQETVNSEENEGFEYTDRLQNSKIKGIYDFAIGKIGKKLIFSSLFAILLFCLENVKLFVREPKGILDITRFAYLHIGLSALLLILCGLCAYEQMYHGFKSIISKDFLPEAVGVIAFIVSLIHTIVCAILVPFGYTNPPLFNFVTASILLGMILFSFVNLVREELGFRAISKKEMKFVLEKVKQNNAEAEYDTFTTTNEDYHGEIARVEKTGFVKNFFHNSNANVDISKFMGIYYSVVMLVSVVFAIILSVKNKSAYMLSAYWGVGIMLMLPVGVLCAYSVPFYLGNKRLFEEGAAIIGEEAIKDFATTNVVVVNDTTAFPPQNIKIQHFNVYGDFTVEKVSYYASNGFSVVGGPLAEVFDAMANNSEPCKRIRFTCSGRGYLCVKVDNDKVIFADKFGMTLQGIEIGNEREGKDDSNVMYIAINGVLAAKLYIKYEIDEEFVKTVRLLNKNGIGVGIRSFDPNLNSDLIKKMTDFKKRELRVIKLTSIKDVIKSFPSKDSKIATKGHSRSVIKAIPVCKKILFSRKVIKAIKIVSSVLGALLMILWIFGKISFSYSAHIVGFHLIFVLIMVLSSIVIMPKLR